jgi:ketosteroid isomerase-like protein
MMLNTEQAQLFVTHWVEAWNAHDLEQIMDHYHADVILISPVAAQILNDPTGTVRGKDAVRAYFQKGLATYPDLKFELIDVMWGLNSVVLYYVNQKGSKTGEFMEINAAGQVTKVVANYNEPRG